MTGNLILVDTNVLIYMLNGDGAMAESLQDQQIVISPLSLVFRPSGSLKTTNMQGSPDPEPSFIQILFAREFKDFGFFLPSSEY